MRAPLVAAILAVFAIGCADGDAGDANDDVRPPRSDGSLPDDGGSSETSTEPADTAPIFEVDEPLADAGAPGDGEAPGEPMEPPDDPVTPPPPPVSLSPGCTAKATLAGVPAWFHFTRPHNPCTGSGGRDRHILDELTRLIGSVPAGGRIDAHIFNLSVDSVAKALLDAQTRGVAVWLSADKQIAASKDTAKTLYLDKLVNKVYCGTSTNSGCIATAADSISHTKLFVFSEATAPDGTRASNVVWFGSANQTYLSGMELTNNTVTLYGEATLYTKLRVYLDDLYRQRRNANYYDSASGRGYYLTPPADVYVSPDLDTDLVINRLNDISPDSTCEVRVMQASIRDSRLNVVDLLVKMKKAGCKVYVVSHNVESKPLAALKAAGIPVRKQNIHDKVFVVKAKYGSSSTSAYRVYTGSHNLSISANTKYDEIFVKLAPETGTAHPVYDAFLTHFDDAWNVGSAL